VAIPGATRSTFVLTTAQRGAQISVTVTGIRSGYATVARSSAKSVRVAQAGTPTISGSTTVGSTLSAWPGTWTSGTTFTYQWYVNGGPIAGAYGSVLTLTDSQYGGSISVSVTGSRGGYQTVTRGSAGTAAVTYPSRTRPIGGTWDCPSWAPIKGNESSMIYHMPWGAFYTRTNPEECFATENDAVAAGYRRSKL
jgi:hypothetical protein